MEFLCKNEQETKRIAAEFAFSLKSKSEGATVTGLYGELGSGKTTFMKYVAEALGVKETIQSPTFVIMKRYDVRIVSNEAPPEFNFLIHIDAYRIEHDQEMLNLGWQEIISNPKNLVFVEWPEKIEGIMPEHKKVIFEHIGENERKIKFQ